jgi:hypothetical protein
MKQIPAENVRKTLTLTHIGRDSWERPVYECDGRLYVDVDPRKGRQPTICTKNGNSFDGEPLDNISEDIKINFIPCRDTWG